MPFNEVFFGKGHRFAMEIEDIGVHASKRWELYMSKRYPDKSKIGEKWAICYGHVEGGDVEPRIITEDMEFTEPECHNIMMLDMDSKAKWLRKKIKVPVTTYMFTGLILLTMNAGQGNVAKGRVLTFLNREKYVSAGAAFMDHRYKWEKVLDEEGKPVINADTGKPLLQRVEDNGLIMRRGFEISIFGTKKD